jgi:uncharacterized membrane protein
LNNYIIELLSNRNAVKKVYDKLDRVIRSDRASNYDNELTLLYIYTIIKIVLLLIWLIIENSTIEAS